METKMTLTKNDTEWGHFFLAWVCFFAAVIGLLMIGALIGRGYDEWEAWNRGYDAGVVQGMKGEIVNCYE